MSLPDMQRKHPLIGTCCEGLTSHEATPIAVYRALHTGPNTQFGGFQLGFFNVCTGAVPHLVLQLQSRNSVKTHSMLRQSSDKGNCAIRESGERHTLYQPFTSSWMPKPMPIPAPRGIATAITCTETHRGMIG